MMPGGHLATSLALGGVAYAATGSAQMAAGCIAGGFLIDVDHYLDYLLFERQWRRPHPRDFLRYYFAYRPQRLVLPLHSLELMTVLAVVLTLFPQPLVLGYWMGAALHLVCDILVNGENALKRPLLFYLFSYRAAHMFTAEHLLEIRIPLEGGKRPFREFFRWRPIGHEQLPKGETGRTVPEMGLPE